jgi:hypothetical protein
LSVRHLEQFRTGGHSSGDALHKAAARFLDPAFFRRRSGGVSSPRTSPLAKLAENNSARASTAIVLFKTERPEILSVYDISKDKTMSCVVL